jgi:hypothetical protein
MIYFVVNECENLHFIFYDTLFFIFIARKNENS